MRINLVKHKQGLEMQEHFKKASEIEAFVLEQAKYQKKEIRFNGEIFEGWGRDEYVFNLEEAIEDYDENCLVDEFDFYSECKRVENNKEND